MQTSPVGKRMRRKVVIVSLLIIAILIEGFLLAHFFLNKNKQAKSGVPTGDYSSIGDYSGTTPFTVEAEFKWIGDEVAFTYKLGEMIIAWDVERKIWVESVNRSRWEFVILYKSEYDQISCNEWKHWNIMEVDGKEALVVTVPADGRLMFGVNGLEGLENSKVSDDLWVRISFRFLNGSAPLIYVNVPPLKPKNESEGVPATFLLLATREEAEKYVKKDPDVAQYLSYVWNTSEWCTVTARYIDFFPEKHGKSKVEKYLDYEVNGYWLALSIPSVFWPYAPRFNETTLIAIGSDTKMFKPSVNLEIKIKNEDTEPIVGVKVNVGGDEVYAVLKWPIENGKEKTVAVAPSGSFEVGKSYEVKITAIYKSGKTSSRTLIVNLMSLKN